MLRLLQLNISDFAININLDAFYFNGSQNVKYWPTVYVYTHVLIITVYIVSFSGTTAQRRPGSPNFLGF